MYTAFQVYKTTLHAINN